MASVLNKSEASRKAFNHELNSPLQSSIHVVNLRRRVEFSQRNTVDRPMQQVSVLDEHHTSSSPETLAHNKRGGSVDVGW